MTIVSGLILCLVAYLILDIFVTVPGAHYGVHLRFGERTGKIFEEGLNLKLPLIEKVELFSMELDRISVKVEFTTEDTLQMFLEGSLQYYPDPRISDDPKDISRSAKKRRGKNTFFAMSDEIIKKGIEETIQSILGGLGGRYTGKDFYANRQALGQLINAILMMKTPPHMNHDPEICEVKGCEMAEKVGANDLVLFYNEHWKETQALTKSGNKDAETCSPHEIRYGIDVETFALSRVDFSEKTKTDLEKKKQADASEAAFDAKMRMAEKAKTIGATAQEALNAADVSIDPDIKKRVVSIEGSTGVLGGLVEKIGG